MSHTIRDLKKAHLAILQSVINSPSWATTPADLYTAGRLLETKITKPIITSADDEATPVKNLSLSERQFGVVKKAIDANAKNIFPSPYASQLLVKFGLVDVEEDDEADVEQLDTTSVPVLSA